MLDSIDTLIAFSLIFAVVSMLVTIIVQILTSLTNLRGHNLAWSVAETFETIEPALAAKTKGLGLKLADHVLRDPLLSDQQIFAKVGRATAVRPEELFDVLHRIATGRKPLTPEQAEIKTSAIRLFRALGLTDEDLAIASDTSVQALTSAIDSLPESAAKIALVQAAQDVRQRVETLATAAVAEVTAAATAAQARVTAAYQKFESWLQTGQERAQEWFTLHARVVTLVVGALLAILLQLDAVDIFKTMSSDRAVRDKLVAQTNAVLEQGKQILADQPAVLSTALGAWAAALPPAAQPAAAGLKVLPEDTRGSLRSRVAKALASLPDRAVATDALAKFDVAVDDAVKTALQAESTDYASVKADLDKTGFSIFPPDGNRWPGRWGIGHVMGIVVSILLLSLGAPFWFNVLKSLASLRSSVAGNIADENKAAQKKDGDQKPGSPPPTVAAVT